MHERPRHGRMRMGHPDYGTGILKLNGLWISNDFENRGPVDMNFCRQDGSVFTLRRLEINDSRLKKLPYENSSEAMSNLDSDYQLLPPADL